MARCKQFNKEEVLQKAKELFWKQGFHATSIQDLVNHLGVNRASLYATFGDKNQLYETAFQAYRKEGLAQVSNCVQAFPSVKKGIQTLLQRAIQTSLIDTDGKGCFVINCTTEYLPKHPHILPDLLQNKADFQHIIATALQKGKDTGELSEQLNVNEVAAYLFTFFNGLNIMAKIKQDRKELERSVALALKVLD